jgi:sec-independent protein translocase protein TatA
MGPIGVQEMVVIFLVALVLFGPKKLPELGKTLAKAFGEFRKAQSELKATFDREMQTIERETASLRETARQTSAEISSYSEIDLHGGSNSSHSTTLEAADSAAPHSSTVSASEVPGAESHAEQLSLTSLYGDSAVESSPGFSQGFPETVVNGHVEGTVARGSNGVSANETNPLPELLQSSSGSRPDPTPEKPNSELPSLV